MQSRRRVEGLNVGQGERSDGIASEIEPHEVPAVPVPDAPRQKERPCQQNDVRQKAERGNAEHDSLDSNAVEIGDDHRGNRHIEHQTADRAERLGFQNAYAAKNPAEHDEGREGQDFGETVIHLLFPLENPGIPTPATSGSLGPGLSGRLPPAGCTERELTLTAGGSAAVSDARLMPNSISARLCLCSALSRLPSGSQRH